MTTRGHGRKFNGKQSYPIPVWSGLLDHRDRMGSAIWEFLWCLNRITTEKDGIGMVNYGNRVRVKDIAADLLSDEKTIRIHLSVLAKRGYIKLRPSRYGRVIEVCNSSKFGIWFPHWRAGKTPDLNGQTGRNARPDRKKCPTSIRKNTSEAVDKAVVAHTENSPMQQSYAANPLYKKEGFAEFWKEYPRGDEKEEAAKVWAKIDPEEHPSIMAGLRLWKRSRQWQKDGGQFIVYAVRFLRRKRWQETPIDLQPTEAGQVQEREMVRAKVPA